MQQIISSMLESYERGRISRRRLVQGLAAIAAATPSAGAPKGTFQGAGYNHVALRVVDVKRSRDFYQKHFGMPVLHESATDCFLGLGKGFLTLFQRPAPAGLDHYCIAIENFKPDAVMEELKRQGFTPRRPSGTDRIYFPDADGLTVQVSSIDHAA